MSYRLEADEVLPSGIRRIALEQIDNALNQLQTVDDDLDKAVHESRKCFKKLRGLLRLVRKEIGETVYQQENACFRDAGRLLSDLRDSAVTIKTLDNLLEAADDDMVEADSCITMRETLVIFYHATYRRVVEEEEALLHAADLVQGARKRVAGWPIENDTFTAVAGGLRKIYKRGRNRMGDAADDGGSEAFHEWRKRVKYLWYSIRILRPIWPQPMAALAAEIHDLSDILGDEHDLARLGAMIADLETSVNNQQTLLNNDGASQALVALIERKRTELQALAFPLGQAIYAESPGTFVHRIQTYWEAKRP